MIKTLVVEDDPISAEILLDLVQQCDSSVRITECCTTVKQALRKIEKVDPDLVFLDVELPDGSGFDLLKKIGTINFEIIFITSHDKYALEAIRHSALDYLVKPIRLADLKSSLKKVEKRLEKKEQKNEDKREARLLNKLAVPTSDGLSFLPIEEIIRIQSDRNYTDFHLTAKRKVLVTKSLKEYELLLRPYGFVRIHHSHMININHIVKYVKGEGGYVVMVDGSTVDVSRRKKEDFLEQLAKA
ncbi:MAG TPA: LytTR family DNA-binding domain-containing protein [Bacteroidia bacterium]|nr:LytTR family DNA-binding domain-containing protein [Bacteroidia bacterium]